MRSVIVRLTCSNAARFFVWLLAALATPVTVGQQPIFTPDDPLDIRHLRLELRPDLRDKRVDAVATLQMTPRRPASSVRLDAVDFQTRSVSGTIGDAAPRPLRYANDGSHVEVFFDRPVEPGTDVGVRIEYAIQDPRGGLHFFQPGEEDPEAPLQLWSQGQAIQHRYWIPCYDHPGEMQTTELLATVDSRFQVLSNGVLVSRDSDAAAGTTTWHWSQQQPHVAYLITLVVGEFHVAEETWRGRPVQYWVPKDRAADVERSFGNTLRMLDFFSDRLKVEYPWPKYVQVCCYNYGGGMENTSATTLGENTLHDERAHLDFRSDGLVAHELAHQWFGDLLTCREWAHIWLNEGFASYFEALWDEFDNGPDEFALNMDGKARGAIAGGKEHPIVHRHYDNPDQQFDSRAYPKGAWVLHMLRRRLGDETFWRVMHEYVSAHRHATVETADLRRCVERVTGRSFERFFYDWTERPGHPVLDVRYAWNADARAAELTLRQTQEAEPFHFPLRLEFATDDESPATILEREMSTRELRIVVPLPAAPVMLRVDPQQSVLMERTEHKPRELWAAQLRRDPDPVGRIRAARELARTRSDQNRQLLADALREERFAGVRSEIAEALGDLGGPVARDALLAAVADPDARVRRAAVAALGAFPDDDAVRAALRAIIATGDQSYRVEAEAVSAYARLRADDVAAVITPALERDSHREMVRSAVLRALGELESPEALAVLTEWCAAGKPTECRDAAVSALASAINRRTDDHPAIAPAVEALRGCLRGEGRRLRSAAARALGSIGKRAAAALAALRDVEARDASDRVRAAAREAIDRIQKDAPAQEQLAELRRQLDEFRQEKDRLVATVEELEARVKALQSAPPPDAPPASAAEGPAAPRPAPAGTGSRGP